MVTLGEDVAAALPELRAEAESMMVTPCRIRRVTGVENLPDGTVATTYADEPIYVGKCKVQDGGGQTRDVEAGSATANVSPLRIDIPATAPMVEGGDLIEILSGTVEQPGDVIRSLRADRRHQKTWQTAQRIPVTELEGIE